MKTAEPKVISSNHQSKTGQPFFQKDGQSASFSDTKTDIQTQPFFFKKTTTPFIQPKLSIGQPGDKYEQEADAMADQVVQRLSQPEALQTKSAEKNTSEVPAIQHKCAACEQEEKLQKKEELREEEQLQRKPIFESNEIPPEEGVQRKCTECEAEEKLQKKEDDSAGRDSLESSLSSSKGSGSPLPDTTRRQMETSFEADFSNVRIHTGSHAQQLSHDLKAQAFTHGSDIYFNSGKFNPESREGKSLLAHELTHTIQQGHSEHRQSFQRVIIGERITMNTLPGRPPRVELLGPYTDSAVALELYGDAAAPVNHSRENYSIVYVNYPSLLARWKAAFGPEMGTEPQEAEQTPIVGPEVGEVVEAGEFRITVNLENGTSVVLSENEEHIRHQLKKLTQKQGSSVLREVPDRLSQGLMQSPASPTYDAPWNPSPPRRTLSPQDEHRLNKGREILTKTRRVASALRTEYDDFLEEFASYLRGNAIAVLTANEERTRSEMVRYGVTWREEDYQPGMLEPDAPFVLPVTSTEFDMGENLPSASGLQDAAKILLRRREAINSKQGELDLDYEYETVCIGMACDEVKVPGPRFNEITQELNDLKLNYQQLLQVVAGEYPILAHFGDLDTNFDSLKAIATQPPGNTTARIIGTRIKEQLEKIEKVKAGIAKNEVNFWKLPRVVGLTKAQLGVQHNLLQNKLVDEKAESEAPGLLQALALLFMDIVAIWLAPATGGISLGIAAGVNIAVAAHDVNEYLLQDALANTDFDRARSLSQQEPSFFWLAVSLAGVIPEIADAARAFRAISRAIKNARTVRTAAALHEAEDVIRAIGREQGLADDLIESIVLRGRNQDESLRVLGVSAEEIDELKNATKIADQEAASAATVVANVAIGSEVKISGRGLIFSCTSPCTIFREKYAAQLASSTDLTAQLAQLEARAAQASTPSARQAVATEVAALEARIRHVPLATWRSPIANSPNFGEMVRIRGSAAPHLDVKPAGWTGTMEARFRYGDAGNSEAGYRWVLQQDGTLRYDRLDQDLPQRIFDPETRNFRNIPPSTAVVALESPEELNRLAHVGREATTKADWFNRLRTIGSLRSLGNDALSRVIRLSPNIDHMKGQLLEELAATALSRRARAAGGGMEFIAGHRIRDAAGRQLTDGLLVRRRPDGTLEIISIVESKAGQASSQGLRRSHKSFSDLNTDELASLRTEAIEEVRINNGLDPEDVNLPAWAQSENILQTHGEEVEALMRQIHTHDMGQIEKDFERLMPMAGEGRTVAISIDGQLTHVEASRARTNAIAVTPNDVPINQVTTELGELGIRLKPLDVGLSSEELLILTRQLRAEVLQNGSRF